MKNPTVNTQVQALELLGRGQVVQAKEMLRTYLADHPKDAAAWNNLGLTLAREGAWKEAALAYQTALSCDRKLAGVHNNMGTALRNLGDMTQAEKAHRRALELDPNLKEAHNNLGLVWMETNRAQLATDAFRRALSFDRNNVAIRENLAKALYMQGKRVEATQAWESALALANPELAWNLSLAELAAGNWERGWRLYECRFHRPKGRVTPRHTGLPLWERSGEAPHLLIWGEQGAGDQIMASRWLRLAQSKVGKLTVECDHRLVSLFQSTYPDIHFFPARQKARPDDMSGITHQIPMLDLPARLGLKGAADYALPAPLKAAEALRTAWRNRLGEAKAPRIALVWAGNPNHVNDRLRSIPLETIRHLVEQLPGAEFHSLQIGKNALDIVGSNLPIQDWTSRISNYEDSAALLELMDAVVTVDTSVVHLAGSLGRPTWLLLPAVPEWRWDAAGKEGKDSLWYDSVHYARQHQDGDWKSAIDAALEGLGKSFPQARAQGKKHTPASRRWQQTVEVLQKTPNPALHSLQQFASAFAVGRQWLQTLLAKKDNGGALQVAEALLQHQPDDISLRLLASDLGRRLGKGDVAVRHARHAVAKDGKNAEAHLHLGNALREAGDLKAAAGALEQALILKPDHTAARGNLGVVKRELGDNQGAIALYREVIKQNPDYLPVRANLGNVLRDEGKFQESADCFRHVIKHDPKNPEAYYGLGNTLKEALQVQEAITAYRQGLAVSPKHSDLKVNISLQLLLDGQLAEGWDLYEERFFRPVRPVPNRKFSQPWWRGEPLKDQRLLLWGEQGAGDRLMFARLLPHVLEQARGVIVETDPRMLSLMQRSFPQANWIAERSPADPLTRTADWQAPIGHLAKVYVRALDQFDEGGPYLKPEPQLVQEWATRLNSLNGKKVGIVWAGNPGHQNDKNRSMPLETLQPLLDLPGLSFVSLQVGDQAGKFGEFSDHFFDAAPMLKSYDDTAALLANLDMVVGVDTSVVHLAGAVGCPAHVLIPYCPDWRWLIGSPDSTPWYRCLHLYRQSQWRDWTAPVTRLVANISTGLGL